MKAYIIAHCGSRALLHSNALQRAWSSWTDAQSLMDELGPAERVPAQQTVSCIVAEVRSAAWSGHCQVALTGNLEQARAQHH